jgi:acyl-CoA synthetase (AMP-forming)/AMP-acid ligase II
MKHSIRYIAMLFACFAINFFFSSCNTKAKFNGKTGQILNDGAINISDYDITDSSLTLRDNNGNNAQWVKVSKNQVVNWNLTGKAAKDIKIDTIAVDTTYPCSDQNFFSSAPHRLGPLKWQAQIKNSSPAKIILEKYYIKWTLKSSGQTYTFDPLLQLNP